MKIQYPVGKLEKGMFVAELDRPWEGTPFLFQGFMIEADEDLVMLRQHCKHVFVDDLQSSQDQDLQDKLHNAVRGSAITTVIFREWAGAKKLRETLKRAERLTADASATLTHLANSTSRDQTAELDAARTAVINLIDYIAADPKTSQWIRILSNQDSSIGQHCVNTATLAVAFAAALGWDKQLQSIVGEGAMLHDVGMAKVPPHIRGKPSALSPLEYGLVKLHPGYAAKQLQNNVTLDPRVLEIVHSHHERLDGSGYPDGLQDGEIPDYVRVVSICDVYDSYTTAKPYRRQLIASAAMRQLTRRSGSHFDKWLVERFIRSLGIYPLGSLVRLRNGTLGIIVVSDEARRLHPTLLMVRDAEGKAELPRRMLNLALIESGALSDDYRVVEIIDPQEAQINVRDIVTQELQLR